jgi:hypothetical protein
VVTNFSKEPRKKEINDDETWMWIRRTGVLLEKPAPLLFYPPQI